MRNRRRAQKDFGAIVAFKKRAQMGLEAFVALMKENSERNAK